jgi:hypothetical protein
MMLNINEQSSALNLTSCNLSLPNSSNNSELLYNSLFKNCQNNNLIASNQLYNNLSSMTSSCLNSLIKNNINNHSFDLLNNKKSKLPSFRSALDNKG